MRIVMGVLSLAAFPVTIEAMKKISFAILCLFFGLLGGCTSQEGKIEKKAQELGERKFQELLQQEADENIKQSDWLNKAYLEFMTERSEVMVSEVKLQSQTRATAAVIVKSYPVSLRRTLAKIAGGIENSRSRRFNFSEALGLVGQQTGGTAETVEQPLITYKFNKTSAGTWVVEF